MKTYRVEFTPGALIRIRVVFVRVQTASVSTIQGRVPKGIGLTFWDGYNTTIKTRRL